MDKYFIRAVNPDSGQIGVEHFNDFSQVIDVVKRVLDNGFDVTIGLNPQKEEQEE